MARILRQDESRVDDMLTAWVLEELRGQGGGGERLDRRRNSFHWHLVVKILEVIKKIMLGRRG